MAINLQGRNFLKLLDLSPGEILALLELSRDLKKAKKERKEERFLLGKNVALIFEKDSTRTRCAFEIGAYDQGAQVTYLGPTSSHIGSKESMRDTARVLGRMYDGIQYRGFGQEIVEELGEHAGVPVWNGLTDEFHPTQVLADFMTMQEHCNKPLSEMSLCYLGDGRNNMANSLMIGAAQMGMDFRIASPAQFQPEEVFTQQCARIADDTGAHILITDDVIRAIEKVDFLYTDVWVSMGEPESVWKERIELLKPYQVNADIIDVTSNPNVKFLHCLPAFHNRQTKIGEEIYQKFGLECLEVTEEVFESEHSVVFDQAENRVHTIKAIMVATMS